MTGSDHTLVDLFAGCGGGSMGFLQAGFTAVAAVEIDAAAAAAYKANLHVKPIVKDIRSVTGPELLRSSGLTEGECALVFGCPPCQSFTILRKGSEATANDCGRNTLYLDYLRLLKSVRPRHLAFENVPGMLSKRWRLHFDALLQGLTDQGYEHVWDVVDAADFGVPQHRKRILVVASRVAKPHLPTPSHLGDSSDPANRYVTVRTAIGSCPPLESGESDADDPYHAARNHSAIALRRLQAIPEGGARTDLPPHLQLDCHKYHDGHYDIYGRMWWDRPAPTLTSGCTNITRGRFGHPDQHRAITIREAMLLQSFPKDAVLHGGVEAMALQVGNAIPPLLARKIGDAVMTMERVASENEAQADSGRSRRLPTRIPIPSRATRSLARSST